MQNRNRGLEIEGANAERNKRMQITGGRLCEIIFILPINMENVLKTYIDVILIILAI